MVARYAARFSVRALDVTVDSSVLWVGAGLAMAAAVLLAYVPRLPSPHAPAGLGLATGGVRITPGTNRRLRMFATTQIAFSFVLLAGAGMLLADAVALQTREHRLRHAAGAGVRRAVAGDRRRRARRCSTSTRKRRAASASCPASKASPSAASCRGATPAASVTGVQFAVEGYTPADGEENPRARLRHGRAPLLRRARRAAARRPRLHRRGPRRQRARRRSSARAWRSGCSRTATRSTVTCGGPIRTSAKPVPRRIVGVVADVDDENVVRGAGDDDLSCRCAQMGVGGRLFVRAAGDPYALVPAVTRIIRELSADQPVERAATLEDVRAEVLAPERLNAFVFSGFAGIALLIAVVGVAGVLAFSVSARTREFGVRLAIGSRAAASAGARAVGGRGDRRDRHRRRRGGRLRARARRGADSSSTCSCRARCLSSARRRCSSPPRSSRR